MRPGVFCGDCGEMYKEAARKTQKVRLFYDTVGEVKSALIDGEMYILFNTKMSP